MSKKLYFRYGAMNCGKSTALLQAAHNYEERGMYALLTKASTDTKGGANVVSRVGMERPVDIWIPEDLNVFEAVQDWRSNIREIDCLLVDEAQFLSPEQVDQLFRIAVFESIPVLAYGLRTDFQRRVFPGSLRLLEVAHSIEEMKTICRCGSKAIFNARKINGEFVFEGSQVAIDGAGDIEYESLCGKCYLQKEDEALANVKPI